MNKVFLFTHSYPFGKKAEVFLEAEIKVASELNIPLTIIPLRRHNEKYAEKRTIPENILLNLKLAETTICKKVIMFCKMLLSQYFWKLPFQGKYSPKTLPDYKNAIKYLYGSFIIKNFILSNKTDFGEYSTIYSYWFTHTSLGAIWAKEKNELLKSLKIITRAHGFDVYEKKVGVYFPYREFIINNIDQIYTVSAEGRNFLSNRYITKTNKLSISRLGTMPLKSFVENKINSELDILSCSSVVPLKRVDLIFSALLSYAKLNKDKKIKWVHIGDGKNFNQLKDIVNKNKIPNFQIDLKEYCPNFIVREILSENYFDIFINLSTSEGIPVSIMEALSAGIPILATDVGGNSEIVTNHSGLLIPLTFSQKQFNNGIDTILSKGKELRQTTLAFYSKNYNATMNYRNFYKQLR